MPNNNEERPHRVWKMYRRAKQVIKNWFITVDNKKFITADGKEFLVKGV